MGLREKLEQNRFFQRFEEVHEEYGIDQRELGKILVIASTTLLVVSIPAVLTLQSVEASVEDANDRMDEAENLINSESFRSSLDALTNIAGYGKQYEEAKDVFNRAGSALNQSRNAEQQLERTYRSYQWLVVVGIIGVISGVVVVYV